MTRVEMHNIRTVSGSARPEDYAFTSIVRLNPAGSRWLDRNCKAASPKDLAEVEGGRSVILIDWLMGYLKFT